MGTAAIIVTVWLKGLGTRLTVIARRVILAGDCFPLPIIHR